MQQSPVIVYGAVAADREAQVLMHPIKCLANMIDAKHGQCQRQSKQSGSHSIWFGLMN